MPSGARSASTAWTRDTSSARSTLPSSFCRFDAQLVGSQKPPDFIGPEIHGRHMANTTPTSYAPNFHKSVAAIMKDEAQALEQSRLTREDQDADEKTRNPRGPRGGGGPNGNMKKEDA